MNRPVLNIVGCGRAARTLAKLWADAGSCRIGDVLTRSFARAQDAVGFIGQGRAVGDVDVMRPAALWLLGVPDREIVPAAETLAASGRVRGGDGVFHLSGFTPAAALAPLVDAGVRIASVHPVMSFADPQLAGARFAGTPCGIEGEATLAAELTALFSSIGAGCFALDGSKKPLYHAGSVFASNFLVVILDVARRAYVDAGVPEEMADRMLAAISRGALDNVLALGTAAALTGPAARGDRDVVALQAGAGCVGRTQRGGLRRVIRAGVPVGRPLDWMVTRTGLPLAAFRPSTLTVAWRALRSPTATRPICRFPRPPAKARCSA